MGKSGDRRPVEARQRDRGGDGEQAPGLHCESPVEHGGRTGVRAQLDVRTVEEPADGLGDGGTEQLERPALGCDEADVRQARPPRRQRQFVDRERPREPRRDDERDGPPGTRAGVAEHRLEQRHATRAVEVQRSGQRLVRAGTDRHDEAVVVERDAIGRVDHVRRRVDAGEGRPAHGDADALDREPGRGGSGERGAYGQLARDVVDSWGEKLDAQPLGRERAQRKDRLEAGYAPAGHQDADRPHRSPTCERRAAAYEGPGRAG